MFNKYKDSNISKKLRCRLKIKVRYKENNITFFCLSCFL